MKTYRLNKNPKIVVTSDGNIDPKYKTVIITYEDGKTQSISVSTLRQHWTEVQ